MWQSKRLGDIATFINGYPFKPSDWNDEGLEIIRIQNLTKSSKECNYYKGEINSKYKITDGDILISWSATLGVFEWKGNDAWLNQHIFKVEFNKEPIDKKFFTFLIEHVLDDLKGQVHGATMKHITKSNFDNTLVPIPPLETQKAISEKLDKADALRKKDQELLKQYDELAQSIFIDMFGDPVQNEKGWEKVKLSDLIERLETGVSVNSSDEFSDYKILKTSCVYTGEFNPNESKYIIEKDLVRAKLNPTIDSIIISRMNTTELVCKCSYINKTYSDIFLPDRLWQTVKGKLKHNVRWLSFVLGYETFLREIQKKSSGTSGSMKNISKTAYLDTDIIYPPLELQNQFAEKIKNIEAQKELVKKQAEESENLFQALLQESFSFT